MRLKTPPQLLSLLALIIVSCSKKDDVEPITLDGRYDLKQVNSEVIIQDEEPEINDKDFSSEGIYFTFSADGTYTTNANVGIGNIEKSSSENKNTYEIENNILKLKITEADLNVPFILYFRMSESMTGTLTLSLNEKDLLTSFEASGADLDPFSQALLQVLISQITTINYSLELTKA
ncbi:hypothetical protein [Jiulongibacter sp. NS-SX5]|uniref:hypothetical protein n=1 Tax=Jiulongibacter sp. NS-SX5 TaxID=3463854 RepID=UPI0040591222